MVPTESARTCAQHLINRGQSKQTTPFPIEIARHDVDDLYRPLAQGTETLG